MAQGTKINCQTEIQVYIFTEVLIFLRAINISSNDYPKKYFFIYHQADWIEVYSKIIYEKKTKTFDTLKMLFINLEIFFIVETTLRWTTKYVVKLLKMKYLEIGVTMCF